MSCAESTPPSNTTLPNRCGSNSGSLQSYTLTDVVSDSRKIHKSELTSTKNVFPENVFPDQRRGLNDLGPLGNPLKKSEPVKKLRLVILPKCIHT